MKRANKLSILEITASVGKCGLFKWHYYICTEKETAFVFPALFAPPVFPLFFNSIFLTPHIIPGGFFSFYFLLFQEESSLRNCKLRTFIWKATRATNGLQVEFAVIAKGYAGEGSAVVAIVDGTDDDEGATDGGAGTVQIRNVETDRKRRGNKE